MRNQTNKIAKNTFHSNENFMAHHFNRRAGSVLLIIVALLASSASFQRSKTNVRAEVLNETSASRHLIICIDGVGFSMIEKMRAEGRFRLFQKPAHMIAPFPTLTNVSMTGILRQAGAEEGEGYEDDFFDLEKNQMRGGLLDRFNSARFIKGTFRELFDYHPSAIKSGLGYAAPPVSTYLEALSDLVRMKQKFKASRAPVFFAYTGASDSLAHLGGERLLRSFMSKLDDYVSDIVRESSGQVEVTIFSDHGNHFRNYRRVSLKAALRRAGFRIESSLRDERSIVFPQYGLVGCGLIFTKAENESRIAEALSSVRGVDFAAFENGNIVHVIARSGKATIERRKESFRYRAESGDPLGLKDVVNKLRTRSRTDADDFIADADWFEATKDAPRPDAVRRIFEGLMGHVRNRANVIVNFEDGYYTGSKGLDVFTFLQATHGNINREQSFGFAMSTARQLPAYVRAVDLWSAIGRPRLQKARQLETDSATVQLSKP